MPLIGCGRPKSLLRYGRIFVFLEMRSELTSGKNKERRYREYISIWRGADPGPRAGEHICTSYGFSAECLGTGEKEHGQRHGTTRQGVQWQEHNAAAAPVSNPFYTINDGVEKSGGRIFMLRRECYDSTVNVSLMVHVTTGAILEERSANGISCPTQGRTDP